MSTPRRIAVIEVNHWHSTYDAAYLTVLQNLDLDIELVGVSDSDAAIAEDRASRYGTTAFTDYREMVDATKPEFVIALGRHVEMPEIARFLIEADLPFMMEKPMGTSADVVSGLADLKLTSRRPARHPSPSRTAARATIPAAAIRSCIETAARKLRQGPQVREGLIVNEVREFSYDRDRYGEDLATLAQTTQFRTGVVVQRQRILRTRAMFDLPWGCHFTLECDDELGDQQQLEAWLSIAGRRIGLGDWRPEKSGDHGRFETVSLTRN